MGDIAIKVENLGKKYTIKHNETYKTFREELIELPKKVLNRFNFSKTKNLKNNGNTEEFWALKDINFEIKKGDKVGIIGRNGAGKSTLLKLISRITEPTTGKITLNGRVGTLLEVGTGFHPELTGRENIFLNGAILGMTREEIKKKFDEIVAFAGVEKFLDTPVKRYSSGMYVRLAFSVAAHLNTEILLVDEVLAVGDVEFQKKSLGKMDEVSKKEGRTILFVSHNMAAIQKLCNKGILLEKGKIAYIGRTGEVISVYTSKHISNNMNNLENINREPSLFRILKVIMLQNGLEVKEFINNGEDVYIYVDYKVFEKIIGLRIYFDLLDEYGNLLFRSFNDEDNDKISEVDRGVYRTIVKIPKDLLAPRFYEIRIAATIYNEKPLVFTPYILRIKVERGGKANRAYPQDPIRGLLAPVLEWKTIRTGEL